ncbi:MAG: glutamate racemase [Flavobacteriales bacterium]|nr:glutamate racemase [Flavobacteriales bacterium]
MHRDAPIGIFDSGIGGLTVTKEIRQALPSERLLYLADLAHMPYGPRTLEEVRRFSFGIAGALLTAGCKLIVVACNTASGAALHQLRERWPEVPFVGMEPAVKPAAEQTRNGVVGVIATKATFQSEVYASVVERFGKEVEVLHQACPGLVQRIEAGETNSAGTERMLRGWLEPMMDRNIDVLVLGCTHYPFVRPLIERIVGPAVRVIDPAPAVARQVARILERDGLLAPSSQEGVLTCWTSGPVDAFRHSLRTLGSECAEVRQAVWAPTGLSLP